MAAQTLVGLAADVQRLAGLGRGSPHVASDCTDAADAAQPFTPAAFFPTREQGRVAMKRIFATAAFCTACASASAQYTGPGTPASLTDVKGLHTAMNDQHVMLEGRIVSQIDGDTYVFADDTGQVKAEIEPRLFPNGQPVDANTRVRITGKLDKAWNDAPMEVDVTQLTVLEWYRPAPFFEDGFARRRTRSLVEDGLAPRRTRPLVEDGLERPGPASLRPAQRTRWPAESTRP
jgi:uncharacterized protein (TIGR00156 family)